MDFTKFVNLKTRSGANIIITEFAPSEEKPIKGAWENGGVFVPLDWHEDGRYFKGREHNLDIDFENSELVD